MNFNQTLYNAIEKKFQPSLNAAEWKGLLAIMGSLQRNGLNGDSQNNPFSTEEALAKLKWVMSNQLFSRLLFPDIPNPIRTEAFTIDGPPSVAELYSLCASKMIDVIKLSPKEIVEELTYRLNNPQSPSSSDNVLINALTPSDASKILENYVFREPSVPLKSKEASVFFENIIKCATNETLLNLALSSLNYEPYNGFEANDKSSLIECINERKNYLSSQISFDALNSSISDGKGLPKIVLKNMQKELVTDLSNWQSDKLYNTLHPVFNLKLQQVIQKLIEEAQLKQNPITDAQKILKQNLFEEAHKGHSNSSSIETNTSISSSTDNENISKVGPKI